MRPFLRGMAAVAVSFICALYLFEIYLTFYSDEGQRLCIWQERGYDLRTKEEMLRQLRAQGQDATVSLTPSFVLKDNPALLPLGGIANHPTVFCNETGRWALYDADEHGFNNPKGLWQPGLDMLLVGASFAQGACVAQDAAITGALRQQYKRTLSLGMDGNGEIAILASLLEYGPQLKPKKVLWLYVENTLGRADAELKNPVLRRYFSEDGFRQDLLVQQDRIDRQWQDYLNGLLAQHDARAAQPGLHLGQWLGLHYVRHYSRLIADGIRLAKVRGDVAHNEQVLRDVLRKADEAVHQWGGTLYFLYLSAPQSGREGMPSDHDRILAVARGLNIPVIDSQRAMAGRDPREINSFNGRGHYNETGYRLFSQTLLEQLGEK